MQSQLKTNTKKLNSNILFQLEIAETIADGKKQSGYAYTAFYFTRDNNVANPSTKTLYDVLLSRNNAAIDITGLTIKDLGSETTTTDNSLYESKTSNGHIELEKDWTAVDAQSNKLTAWDGKTDGTTQYDSDPKVSGKITIKGTAHDDKLIESISANEYWVGGIVFWTSVGFAYDQKGHSFSTVAGGDINSD